MRVRIKFTKTGSMKYIGHLDVMRYFQKALRRAHLDVAFSEGFSPHMLMSFAAPLGVGITSSGEYFDLDLKTGASTLELTRRLNEQMAEGIEVLSVRQIREDKASKCMTLVAAADYLVTFRPGKVLLPENWQEKLADFMKQEAIWVNRKTKRSEQETDIRPWIYRLEARENGVFLQLSSGSVHNLKPELVMQAFGRYLGLEYPEYALQIHRLEIYADQGEEGQRRLVTLESLGEEIL